MKSNCHLTAWQRFRTGKARWLSIRATNKSKFVRIATMPVMLPFRLLGICIQWLAWACVHLGEFLRTGRWYHVTWHEQGEHMEFVRGNGAPSRWLPPVLFEGKIQRVQDGPDKDKKPTRPADER